MDGMNRNSNVYAVRRSSTLYLVIGWISAIISLLWLPYVFGVFGVVMGIVATKNGSRAGVALIMGSIAFMAVGLIFGGVFLNYFRHFMGF